MPKVDFTVIVPKFRKPELLTHPQIPYPLSGVAPRTIQHPDWWDKQRHAAYAGNNQYCWACGGDGPLEAHEVFHVDYKRGRMYFKTVVALCNYCHSFIHSGYLGLRLLRGQIKYKEYKTIILHGHGILMAAKLKANWGLDSALENVFMHDGHGHKWMKKVEKNIDPRPRTSKVPWNKWRMVYKGKEYPPKYSSAKVATETFALEVQT